jgi:predicted ArsR family transcriptional regulator
MAGRREQVLATLRDAGTPLSINEIAERLAVHPNTARFHLEELVRRGRVETVRPVRTKPGRPPQLFRAARGMDPEGPRDYQMLAGVLADALARHPDAARQAQTAGRAWAKNHTQTVFGAGPDLTTTRTQAVDRLTALLDEMGFAPEQRCRDGAEVLELRNCPFLELAVTRRDVICPVHLGLMQGAMESWRAPVTVKSLQPFAEPGVCVAQLAPRTAGPRSSGPRISASGKEAG